MSIDVDIVAERRNAGLERVHVRNSSFPTIGSKRGVEGSWSKGGKCLQG